MTTQRKGMRKLRAISDAEVVLADEEEVREGAEERGFDVRGCLGILLESVKRGILTPQKAIKDGSGR